MPSIHTRSHRAFVKQRGAARGLLVVNTGRLVSKLHNRMPSTGEVLLKGGPAHMESARLARCCGSPPAGGETRHRKHRRTSSIIQITCKVLVSGGMGMGALLATLEAMGQCVPSSHQGALPRGLLHAPYTCAAIGHSSSKGALLDAYWW